MICANWTICISIFYLHPALLHQGSVGVVLHLQVTLHGAGVFARLLPLSGLLQKTLHTPKKKHHQTHDETQTRHFHLRALSTHHHILNKSLLNKMSLPISNQNSLCFHLRFYLRIMEFIFSVIKLTVRAQPI